MIEESLTLAHYNDEPVHPAKLRQVLEGHFNESELHALYFDLGVNYDALPG